MWIEYRTSGSGTHRGFLAKYEGMCHTGVLVTWHPSSCSSPDNGMQNNWWADRVRLLTWPTKIWLAWMPAGMDALVWMLSIITSRHCYPQKIAAAVYFMVSLDCLPISSLSVIWTLGSVNTDMIPGRCLQEWITVLYDNLLTLCTRMEIWSSLLYWICVHLINWIKQTLEWYGLGDFRINKNCYKIYCHGKHFTDLLCL